MSAHEPTPPDITVPYDQFQIYSILAWIEANGYKPHVLVDTKYVGIQLPPQCMVKPQEVLNLHSNACVKMNWQDDRVEFNARFGGRDFRLKIPFHAILAINFAGTSLWIPMPWVAFDSPAEEGQPPKVATTVSVLAQSTDAVESTTEQSVSAAKPIAECNVVRAVDFSKGRKK